MRFRSGETDLRHLIRYIYEDSRMNSKIGIYSFAHALFQAQNSLRVSAAMLKVKACEITIDRKFCLHVGVGIGLQPFYLPHAYFRVKFSREFHA